MPGDGSSALTVGKTDGEAMVLVFRFGVASKRAGGFALLM